MVKSQTSLGMDMVAQMPESLFQDKDYLSMRYFYRRAYYVAYIAAHVRKEMGDAMSLKFELLNENPLLPVLVLQPQPKTDAASGDKANDKASKKQKKLDYSIRIIPCAPDTLFPWSKLTPASNSTRLGDTDEKKGAASATPFYNSTLNAERTFIKYLRILTHAKNECPAFPDACILGRIWLQQRGYGGAISQGGFGHFEWAIMLAILLQIGGKNGQPALSTSLSSTELFKAGIQFLSTTDFNKKPFYFNASNVNVKGIREPGPVMFDPVRELNILYKMSPWSSTLLQTHAKTTSDLLADEGADKFEPVFIMKTDLTFQIFDTVFEIDPKDLANFPNSADRSGVAWDFGVEVHKVLKRAYANRAQLVHVQLPSVSSWSLANSSPTKPAKLLVGVIFDSTNMPRQMEHGPPAEEAKEAALFRQFWGAKAELRRFKDGSILECVEWSSKLPVQICEEIARYSLQRHLKLAKDDLIAYENGFSSLVNISNLDKEAFDSSRKAFTAFERNLRDLEDLPLQIRQLSPVSDLARYSSLEPPMLGFHKGSVEPMDVNLYFEASSKWPENLTAIQEAKIEFLLDFDRRLTAAHDSITTYLGRENRDIGIENLAYLDIVYDNGAAFRLRIHCDLEETLLQRQVANKTLDPAVREGAEKALESLNWNFTILPLHTQTIATFCTRLQPMSSTIRLVKQWFASHKLRGHISDELIELFVLHAFLQPYPWKIPSSPVTGFLRTLFFLAKWDWREEPLIVDSAETITSDERSSIRRTLESWRKRDPHMNHSVILVATSSDQSGLAYTRNGPSKLIASRMTRLAKAAAKIVREQDVQLDAAALFASSLTDYDVLIHLSSKAIKNILGEAASESGAKKQSQFKNLDNRTGKLPLPIREHPASVLVEELTRVYEDTLIFFSGGADAEESAIAAIWNPKLQDTQKFRAGLPYNFRSLGPEGDDTVEVNRQAVLLELARAGGDMIRKIEVVGEEEE